MKNQICSAYDLRKADLLGYLRELFGTEVDFKIEVGIVIPYHVLCS